MTSDRTKTEDLTDLAALPDPLSVDDLGVVRGRALAATVRPPGSKSLTNRLLLLAALAGGESVLRGALVDADDARRMLEAVAQLGVRANVEGTTVRVAGVGGQWRPAPDAIGEDGSVELFLNNAGTATRFLCAASLLSPVPLVIDGNERMRERPIGELAEALRTLGVLIDDIPAPGKQPGCPPLRLRAPETLATHDLSLSNTKSSQFLSALLLVAPWINDAMGDGLTIHTGGRVTSASYVVMTLDLLRRLGAPVKADEAMDSISVGPPTGRTGLDAFEMDVEPDASGATYFWTAAAIVPGAEVTVPGLGARSLQGDANFGDALAAMGATVRENDHGVSVAGPAMLHAIDYDMRDMPDAVMSLAVACAFAVGSDGRPGRSVIRGVRTLRVKETDRIAALRNELGKIGVRVEEHVGGDDDVLAIVPPTSGVDCSPDVPRVEFDTYDDHRMAMSLALLGLRRPNVWIRDPGCVAKTYAGYWRDLAKLCRSTKPSGSTDAR